MIKRVKALAAEEEDDKGAKVNPPYKVNSTDLRIARQLCTKLGLKGFAVEGSGADFVCDSFTYELAYMRTSFKDDFAAKAKEWASRQLKARSLFTQFAKFYDKHVAKPAAKK